MTSPRAALALLLAAPLLITPADGQLTGSPTAPATPSRTGARAGRLPQFVVVDRAATFTDSNWSQIPNFGAHAQDALVSHAGWQYLGYWDENRNLALARRRLPTREWEVRRFLDYQNVVDDSHNAVNVGVATGDGTIHLSFDHHVDDLNYRVSAPGLATTPEAFDWGTVAWSPVLDELDPADGTLGDVTYPQFVPTPEGDLLLSYREFGSGNGRERMVRYDATTGSWSDNHVWMERAGTYLDPLGGASTARNAYFNRIHFDSEGTLHATWTWRENASVRYNRDVGYAYSTDGGVVWKNGAGDEVADTSAGQALAFDTPGLVGVPLGAEWGLMNNQGHAVDLRGRVHAVMYRKDVPDTTVSYGNAFDSHFVHDWRDADGAWRSFRLPTMGDRPKLVADAHGNLVLAYRRARALALDVATPEAGYADWQRRLLLDGDFRSSVQVDFALMDEHGVLSVALQTAPDLPGATSQVGVVDLFLDAPVPPTPDVTLDALADAFGRGGVHADDAFGTGDKLVVKDDPNPDFDREAFLRFDVSGLAAVGTIARAELVMTGAGRSDLARTTPYHAHGVVDDAWDEATLTWNTRPALGAPVAAHFARDDCRWDVTELVAAEVAGDGTLSVGLSCGLVGGQRAFNLWAREAANPARRPRLEVFLAP